MNINNMEILGPVLNLTALMFCLAIIVYLGYHFLKYQKPGLLKKNLDSPNGDMNREIAIQIIKQETEKALNNILETLNKEHKRLQKTLQIGDLRVEESCKAKPKRKGRSVPVKEKAIIHEHSLSPNREVLDMLRQGKNPEQISNKMKISLEEIDLILDLENEKTIQG